jgi:hypothetical protein
MPGLFSPDVPTVRVIQRATIDALRAKRPSAPGPACTPDARPRVWEARPSPGRSLVRYGVVGGTSIVWIIRIVLSRPPSYSTSLRYPSHPPFRSATPRHPGHPPSAALLNSRSLAPTRLDACGYCCSQGQRSTWDPGDAVLRPLEPLESWGRLGDGGRQAGSQAARIPPSRPR